MKYLVLHQFRSFGKTLHKGDVVDESEIRSPHLRMSEGKIIPAVSSSTVPAAQTPAEQAEQAAQTATDEKVAEQEQQMDASVQQAAQTPAEQAEQAAQTATDEKVAEQEQQMDASVQQAAQGVPDTAANTAAKAQKRLTLQTK